MEVVKYLNFLSKEKPNSVIRCQLDSPVSIRCKLEKVVGDEQKQLLVFNGLSEQAIKRLREGVTATVEIIFNEDKPNGEKISFKTTIAKLSKDRAGVTVPLSLNDIIRRPSRAEDRIEINPNFPLFLKVEDFEPVSSDLSAAPIFGLYSEVSNLIPIINISQNGLSVENHFPSFYKWIEDEIYCENCSIVVPLEEPIVVEVEMLWQKRLKTQIKTNHKYLSKKSYRVGFRLHNLSDQNSKRIEEVMKRITGKEI